MLLLNRNPFDFERVKKCNNACEAALVPGGTGRPHRAGRLQPEEEQRCSVVATALCRRACRTSARHPDRAGRLQPPAATTARRRITMSPRSAAKPVCQSGYGLRSCFPSVRYAIPENSQTLELTVLNRLGIHARPAAEFVRCAQRFPATKITIVHDGETFVSTSILEVLSASLEHGAKFTVQANGPEAPAALAALTTLMEHLRDEEDAAA